MRPYWDLRDSTRLVYGVRCANSESQRLEEAYTCEACQIALRDEYTGRPEGHHKRQHRFRLAIETASTRLLSKMNRNYTDQDRIDEQTMRIENPNVVGSGYIQFPPQRPFEKPVQVQPPTVAHLDYPQEYQNYAGPNPAPQPGLQQKTLVPPVHGPQVSSDPQLPEAARLDGTSLPIPHYATQPARPGARPAAPPVQRQNTGTAYQTGPRPSNAPLAISSQQQQPRPQQQYVPRPVHPQQQPVQSVQPRQPPTVNGYHVPVPQARPAAALEAASALSPASRIVPDVSAAAQVPPVKLASSVDGADDTSHMSKAQKQRLRKKLREGRA